MTGVLKKHTNKQGLLSSVTPTHGKVLPSIAFKLIFFIYKNHSGDCLLLLSLFFMDTFENLSVLGTP